MVRTLALIAVLLTLLTIALGAYVRTSDTESACAQWPGCFGSPVTGQNGQVQPRFDDDRPIDMAKIRLDIRTHRSFAGAVGVTVLLLSAFVWTLPEDRLTATFWAMASLCMVAMQTALGMWTLEHALLPLAVTAHLLLGYSILVALYLTYLAASPRHRVAPCMHPGPGTRWLARIGLILLASQLALGGWTSTHQAGLACPDFPTCLGQWWPGADYSAGFGLWRPAELDAASAKLPPAARVAIHVAHRVGGLLSYTALTLLALAVTGSGRCATLRPAGMLMSFLVLASAATGVAAVLLRLPGVVVVAHTVVAGLLTLNVVYVNLRIGVTPSPSPAE